MQILLEKDEVKILEILHSHSRWDLKDPTVNETSIKNKNDTNVTLLTIKDVFLNTILRVRVVSNDSVFV